MLAAQLQPLSPHLPHLDSPTLALLDILPGHISTLFLHPCLSISSSCQPLRVNPDKTETSDELYVCFWRRKIDSVHPDTPVMLVFHITTAGIFLWSPPAVLDSCPLDHHYLSNPSARSQQKLPTPPHSSRPRAAVAFGRHYDRSRILYHDPQVIPQIASRGPFDEYLNFETPYPRRLEHLSQVEREDRTRARGTTEIWRYDEDDRFPALEGPEELERQLVDDYEAKYIRLHMALFHDPDHQALTTDPTLTVTTPERKQITALSFRLSPTESQPRREVQATTQRPTPVQTLVPSMPLGTPISMQSQLKRMQVSTISSVRIPSSGSMRPPAPPMSAISSHLSPPIARTPAEVRNPSTSEGNTQSQSQPETQAHLQPEPPASIPVSTSPTGPPSQSQQQTAAGMDLTAIANSYHIPVTGFSTTIFNSTSPPTPFSIHQFQPTTGNLLSRVPARYIGHVNSINYDHLQARQLHRPQQAIPTNGFNGTTVLQPNSHTGAFQRSTVDGIQTNGIIVLRRLFF